MGETRNAYKILLGTLLENIQLEEAEGDGRIILRWTLGK
jgi:hypothetical protein